MEARSSLRKVKCLGLITCCVYGQLSDPQLITTVNSELEPDVIAKALGVRSLIRGIMSTVTYRQLRNKGAIYMFRFGVDSQGDEGNHETKVELESMFEMFEHEENEQDGSEIDQRSSMFGLADPTSVSPILFRHIQTLPFDPVRGANFPGVTRAHVKKHLKYRFTEKKTGCFEVMGMYRETTVVDSFELDISHLTNLMALQTRLYTPDNSNTTFVLPKLIKFIGELQMRSVLM